MKRSIHLFLYFKHNLLYELKKMVSKFSFFIRNDWKLFSQLKCLYTQQLIKEYKNIYIFIKLEKLHIFYVVPLCDWPGLNCFPVPQGWSRLNIAVQDLQCTSGSLIFIFVWNRDQPEWQAGYARISILGYSGKTMNWWFYKNKW